jgi:hypothetical protein
MGAQTPEQRIVALIKAAAAEVEVRPTTKQAPPKVVVYGQGSVVAAGDVHIHHHHYGGRGGGGVHSGLNPERE